MHMRLVTPVDRRDPPHYEPPTAEQWDILKVQEALFAAVKTYGADRVRTWLDTMAALAEKAKGVD